MSDTKKEFEERAPVQWDDTLREAARQLFNNAVATGNLQFLGLIVKPNGDYSYSCMSTDANNESTIRHAGGELAMQLFNKKR